MTNVTPLRPIAYVMTHYPRLALTYISGEIDAVEARGLTIVPFAMNAPAPDELSSEDMIGRAKKTIYLKQRLGRGVAAIFGQLLVRPLSTMRLVVRAVRSAGGDMGLIVRRLSHLAQGALVAAECRKRNIGHIHAHFGQAPASIAWFAASFLQGNTTQRVGWSFTIHGFQDFVDEAIARLDLKAASADFVVCVSDFTRSQLCRITPTPLWSKFEVVRCGIALKAFAARPEEAQSAVVEIVSVGRLSPEKGFSILLEALAELRGRDVTARLSLIGDGPDRAELTSDIERLGLGDMVTLTGELPPEQVAARLRTAQIFCLPSFSEGLPISIMEAMASGVPVVATNIAGIPELARNEVTALTVPASNAQALAAALERLIVSPELRRSLATAARTEVERLHDREASADRMVELFGQAAS
jgi:glycosyltransferase involved in cell wall biosynthesis